MGWYKNQLNKTNKELTLDLISNCPELVDALKTNNLEEALDIVMHENHRRDLFYDNREAKSIFIHFLYENGISIFDHMNSVPPYAFWSAILSDDFVIPDSVRDIELCAFTNSNLDHIPLTKNSCVEDIYQDAFSSTNIHGDVVLPDSLQYLEASAFYNTEVTSVLIPKECQVEDYDNYGYELLRK